jgi:hypothetical protein
VNSRPLGRSLDPLPGEALNGFLLRLSFRLHLSPARLARLTGIAAPYGQGLPRRLLLDADAGSLAAFARLSRPEASALTLLPWADRYPPAARSLRIAGRQPQADDWLFAPGTRYCPRCLAGDGGALQAGPGGCWKLSWQLAVAFACTVHGIPLQDGCPRDHPAGRGRPPQPVLIPLASDSGLHPAQCRLPGLALPGSRRAGRQACGQRLDEGPASGPGPGQLPPGALALQQRLLAMLDDPGYPAGNAAARFTDLRVITAMLCLTWPASKDLTSPSAPALISRHVSELGIGNRSLNDRPPRQSLAAAGLLTAADSVIGDLERQAALARLLRASGQGHKASAWVGVFDRHGRSCSPGIREAFEPGTRAYRMTSGPRRTKAPARDGGYGPEHIPALLERHWHDRHLAGLGYPGAPKSIRRAGSVLLVQWASGGSMRDAAEYLGVHNRKAQYLFPDGLARWLGQHGTEGFSAALRNIAAHLDTAATPVNYQRRRQALQQWCLDPGTWEEIINRQPPATGPFQPVMDDRKRQECSAFTWAYVTQGESLFAPRPIEASRPESVRREWAGLRDSTQSKLARSGRPHTTGLRKLLIEYGDRLARDIDGGSG